jgi:hypothetical protein
MRSKLLISAAAVLAGVTLASAQDMQKGGGGAGHPPSAQGSGPASASPQGSPGQHEQGSKGQAQKGTSAQKEQTTGQAPQGQKDQGAQGKSDQTGKAQSEHGSREQTGQGQREQDQGRSQAAPQRQQGQTGQTGQQERSTQSQPSQQQGQTGQAQSGQSTTGQAGSRVMLTTEQRTKIRQTVLVGGNAPRATNVNFNIAVGTAVPSSVHVVEVPDVIVEIHPEWRGYWYFVVGDEIIIVDRSHRIVAVLAV